MTIVVLDGNRKDSEERFQVFVEGQAMYQGKGPTKRAAIGDLFAQWYFALGFELKDLSFKKFGWDSKQFNDVPNRSHREML